MLPELQKHRAHHQKHEKARESTQTDFKLVETETNHQTTKLNYAPRTLAQKLSQLTRALGNAT